jgi:hypothetical protein
MINFALNNRIYNYLMTSEIPKIIHQLWIGDKPAPTKMMNTWRDMNPDYEYIRWGEKVIKDREIKFVCKNRINEMEEINGKADIMRWELLYEYGGIFIDADSYCVKPIDEQLSSCKAFAGWEHEELRKGLIATGTMGFPPKHPLCLQAIEWIKINCVNFKKCGMAAWQSVGPGLLTRMYNLGYGKDMTIFPSYYFLPIHCTGKVYKAHGVVYAYQEWGSTKKSYDTMHNVELPYHLLPPKHNVSILISSYNTKAKYVKECLDSIRDQEGLFGMEIVWINDGSDTINTTLLKRLLDKFLVETRFTTLIYDENDGNKGIGFTLNKGIPMCTHEVIVKMDSDDIMVKDRIAKQFTMIMNNSNIKICGGQVKMFDDQGNDRGTSNHQSLTWDHYKNNISHWFINHPTVCYRKSAVLECGNYNGNLRNKDGDDDLSHDFELELRMLKKYGYIYNFPEVLVKYRIHENQVTFKGGKSGTSFWNNIRKKIIDDFIT